MSTLIVKGSPRKNGNSAWLADLCAEELRRAGEEVEVVSLAELSLSCCRHCDACRTVGKCVIEDDMQELYPKLLACDRLVIAAPTYWFNVNAQTKIFIDRFYALAVERDEFPWKVGVIMTGEASNPYDSGAANALRGFQDTFTYLKSEVRGFVYCSADKAGEARSDESAAGKVRELAAKLLRKGEDL